MQQGSRELHQCTTLYGFYNVCSSLGSLSLCQRGPARLWARTVAWEALPGRSEPQLRTINVPLSDGQSPRAARGSVWWDHVRGATVNRGLSVNGQATHGKALGTMGRQGLSKCQQMRGWWLWGFVRDVRVMLRSECPDVRSKAVCKVNSVYAVCENESI